MRAILVACIAVTLLGAALAHEDFYAALGLDPEATPKQIKRAYRKLSLKFHPDKNPGDEEAAKRFQEINRAHEVLSDDEKKQIYDQEGLEGLEQHEKGGGRQASPFDMFFGGGGGGRRKGHDLAVDTDVTLEELYNGAKRSARIARNVICKKCRGTGAKDGKTKKCGACGGRGVRLVQQQMAPGFNVQMQQTCDKCGGKGQVFQTKCPKCQGRKVVNEEKVLTATIERGMASDAHIRFERESEQSPGTTPGDVIFRLHLKKHRQFERKGDDLHYTMHISLKEALLGFKKQIKQLDGRMITVEHTGITRPFEVRTIAEEGMPVHNFPSQKGKLFVKFHVDFPRSLSDAQQASIASTFGA